ncbi:7378_t:CDS:2, partial [Rhizophagus irregularis]
DYDKDPQKVIEIAKYKIQSQYAYFIEGWRKTISKFPFAN